MMNSKERNNDMDVKKQESSETNDNELLSSEPGNNCKSPKVQNGISSEHHKFHHNNNVETRDDKKCVINKSSCVVSNGSASSKLDTTNPTINSIVNNSQSINCFAEASSASRANDNDGAEDADMRNNVDYICGINKCPPKVSCSSSSNTEINSTWPQTSSYASECALNNIGGNIGSTSQGTCCFLRPNINGSRDIAGPSGIPKRDHVEKRDSSSSENEGDDLSDAEDYCIYTYKGNDVRLRGASRNVDDQEAVGQQISGRSSPEMDFLEMDFDPGPSCEQDTGDSDLASINEDIQNIALDNVESDLVFLNDLSSGSRIISRQAATSSSPQALQQNEPNVSDKWPHQQNEKSSEQQNTASQCLLPSTSSGLRRLGTSSLYRGAGFPSREAHGYHNTSGDLISPGDSRDVDSELWVDTTTVSVPDNSSLQWLKVNLSSTLWHRMMAKKLMLHKETAFSQSGESNLESELCNDRLGDFQPVDRLMIWSEQEATMKQITQIATSACGATSAVNALLALDVPFSFEVLVKGVATRLREPGTPLPKYLVSRSLAGATHRDIMRGISLATNGAVITKFFAFYPEPAISLSHWLHYWISKGAIPIATLNLQNCGNSCEIRDAWHHQMIFGVSQAGIYLTNPLECLPEQWVWHQLVSPSVLLIRRNDVLAHWNPTTDLTPLMQMDHSWRKLNVLGQVVNMVRESMIQKRTSGTGAVSVSHIRIPASYQAGITLVMRSDASAADELLHAESLPLL